MEKMICLGYLSYRFFFVYCFLFWFFVFPVFLLFLGLPIHNIGLFDVSRTNAGFPTRCMKLYIPFGKKGISLIYIHTYWMCAVTLNRYSLLHLYKSGHLSLTPHSYPPRLFHHHPHHHLLPSTPPSSQGSGLECTNAQPNFTMQKLDSLSPSIKRTSMVEYRDDGEYWTTASPGVSFRCGHRR